MELVRDLLCSARRDEREMLMKAKCQALLLATGPLLGCSGVPTEDLGVSTTAVENCDSEPRDLGVEVLAPNDGWAALDAGTTGGSLATPE